MTQTVTGVTVGNLPSFADVNGNIKDSGVSTNALGRNVTLTGDVTGSGIGTIITTLTNSAVTGQHLTGYVSSTGTVSPTDSILTAIQKINGNTALLTGAIIYQGTWNASANTPTLVSGIGIKGELYKVNVSGSTNLDGISSWNVGDSAVFDGTVWDKIDGLANEVISVAGRTGVVVLTQPDVSGTVATTTTVNGHPLSANVVVSASDITTGTLPAAQLPDPTASTKGGVQSIVAVAHEWVNSISTAGVPTQVQPTANDILGTTTNDNAVAGYIGEFISSSIGPGAPVTLLNATQTNITTISLTAGDWDVFGNVLFSGSTTTDITIAECATSNTSATLPAQPAGGSYALWFTEGIGNGKPLGLGLTCGTQRFSLAGPATIYLVAQASYTGATVLGWGFIGARRAR